jgi:hypothetical protein
LIDRTFSKDMLRENEPSSKPSLLQRFSIAQIGMVVKDLDAAVEGFYRTAGIAPWRIVTTGAPPLTCLYHGRPAEYQIKLATAQSGSIQLELIQYLSGDTIHRDFLEEGRTGLEHMGIFVPDLEAALPPYLDQGIGILQTGMGMGVNGDGCYAYLDTEPIFGTILELIQSATQPVPPERVYP